MKMTPDDSTVPDCGGAMSQLFDLLDGELTPERERVMRAHIAACPDCFSQAGFEQRFLAAVAAAKDSGTAPEALRARVIGALRGAGWSGVGTT